MINYSENEQKQYHTQVGEGDETGLDTLVVHTVNDGY